MPVLARFGQFGRFRQFAGNSPRSPPEGSRGLVESWSKRWRGALALRPLSPGARRGITAGDPGGEFAARRDVGCGVPDGLVVDPRPVVHQKRGRKLASPGGQLCLRHQEIARAEDAGRTIRSEGPRCVAACFGTPTSPSSTAPTTAGIAYGPACWPRRSCSSPTTR